MNKSEKKKLISYINENKKTIKEEHWDAIQGDFFNVENEIIYTDDVINFIKRNIK